MNVGIFPNMSKSNLYKFWNEFIEYLKLKNIQYYIPKSCFEEFKKNNIEIDENHFKSTEWIGKNSRYIFSIGGDGSFLNASKKMADYSVSIAGIHLGDLGFLNSIAVNDFKNRINQLIDGDYIEEKRAFLEAKIIYSDGNLKILHPALNDVVIGRGRIGTMVRMNLFVNQIFAKQYPADGMVFSTATGSTGYSLSCGGPILFPCSEQFLVVPVCAHVSKKFPIVLNPDDIVTITIPERQKSIEVSIDGEMSESLSYGDRLEISIIKKNINFIRFKNQNFLEMLNEKL
ncbi:NAD(+)/NADH kinase [Dialister micraerophilus]|uniref:NAD kinase n=1 Tax=Dialister micraerophilus DSM 19965 TaxID=888062 RepID=F2BVH5_9FIRM|nr:NAD(+) kinase [Dialister micraerophilus DSM 19965]